MIPDRSSLLDLRPIHRRIGRLATLLVVMPCMLLRSATAAPASPQLPPGPPPVLYPWEGPWDYQSRFGAQGCTSTQYDEISHASLIPAGLHEGKVVLWRRDLDSSCQSTGVTTSWLFDPSAPGNLIYIDQVLPTSMFCSGTAWDGRGNLLVAGGLTTGHSAYGESYRFYPSRLNSVTIVGGQPTILVTPSNPPWEQLGDMSIPRYYPTVVPLARPAVDSCTGTTISSGCLAIGGPPVNGSAEGNEFWDLIGPTSNQWSCPILPPVPSHPAPTPPFLSYSLHALPGLNPPGELFDSYPRAIQLSTYDVFIAFDVLTGASPPPGTNDGDSWGIKPSFTGPPTDWRLWRGPRSDTLPRVYGTAACLHTIASRDRVLIFGGDGPSTPPAPYEARADVQEFIKGSTTPNAVANGQWTPVSGTTAKAPMAVGRNWPNSVVLPTGQILLIGGATQTHTIEPALVPEIYDPGLAPTSTGSTSLIPPGNNTMRLYHQVALLLRDGRVFYAGGEYENNPAYLQGKYTAEVYNPPYMLFTGFKPVITTPPPSSASLNQFGSTSVTFTLDVSTASANVVDRVVLLRPGSVTHHFDDNQRYIELAFSDNSSGGAHHLTVTSPEETIAPVGYYMLFVIETESPSVNRIPSVGTFIRFL